MSTSGDGSGGAGRPVILVVDDDRRLLNSFKVLFEVLLPICVETAQSGLEGLEVLKRGHVRLVIADFRMPGMNGLEFIRCGRAIAPAIPFYLFTAYADDTLRPVAQEAAPQRCLSKADLAERIAALIAEDLGLEPPPPL